MFGPLPRSSWGAPLALLASLAFGGSSGCGQGSTSDLDGADVDLDLDALFETAVYGAYQTGGCVSRVPVCFRPADGESCVRTVLVVDECGDDSGHEVTFWACDADQKVDLPNAQFTGALFWGHGSFFVIGSFDFEDGAQRAVNVQAESDAWADLGGCAPPPG